MGSLSQNFLGTTIWQFSHESASDSKVLLGRRPPKLLSDEERLGKYGLCEGDWGLVGGVSKDESLGRRPSLSDAGWS